MSNIGSSSTVDYNSLRDHFFISASFSTSHALPHFPSIELARSRASLGRRHLYNYHVRVRFGTVQKINTAMASLVGGSIRWAVRSRAAPLLRTGVRVRFPVHRAASGLSGHGGSLKWIIAAGVGIAGITTFSVSAS